MPICDGTTALLVAPAYDHGEYLGAESLGLRAVAAAVARRDARVIVIDECPTPPNRSTIEIAAAARLIGIGVLFTRQIPDAILLAQAMRKASPQAHITIGGQGLESLWQDVLRDCPALDSACVREADETIGELWECTINGGDPALVTGAYVRVANEIVTAGRRPPVADLDSLPFVHRDDGDTYRHGHATMYTSRGCAAHCSFCQSGNYGNRHHSLPRWRCRTASHVVDEIESLATAYGVRALSIVDDDFLGGDGRGRDRAIEFARLLKDRRLDITFSIECRVDEIDADLLRILREVGLRHVLIGIESANDRDSMIYAKKTTNSQVVAALRTLREVGIDFSVGFIMFHPLSRLDDIGSNLAFMKEHRIGAYRRVTNRLELYPGAPLASYYRRRDVRFRVERYRLYYEFRDPNVGSLYEAMRNGLVPFSELERIGERARFRASTGRVLDLPPDLAIKRSRDISDDMAIALVRSAEMYLENVVRGGDAEHRASIDRRVAREAARLRASFSTMDPALVR